jgi:hypothetical protein
MASIHTLHTDGIRTSVDSSAQLNLRLHADCRSQSGTGIPITARTLTSGWYAQAPSRQQTDIGSGYVLVGPALPVPGRAIRAWRRSPATHQQWLPVDLYRDPAWNHMPYDPLFSPDPAYLNQVCPDLLRLTYLASPLPYHSVLGLRTLNGRQVWDLHEQPSFKLDLFVDARSYLLRRLLLWDGASTAPSHWRIQIDYSRFGAPLHFTAPPRAASDSVPAVEPH